MLRNLVTSLFEHEQITTTLPKARDAARLAEKVITMGKKGDNGAYSRARSFLLLPGLVSKVFGPLQERYANRPGGYTRIHKIGNRPGDNAPRAVLELVDNPRDLKMEMTARAVGWEMLKDRLSRARTHEYGTLAEKVANEGTKGVQGLIEREREIQLGQPRGLLRPKTRWNLQKVLRFRSANDAVQLGRKAGEHLDRLLATPFAIRTMQEQMKEDNPRKEPGRRNTVAGQKLPGETRSAITLSEGALGHFRPPPSGRVLSVRNLSRRKRTTE